MTEKVRSTRRTGVRRLASRYLVLFLVLILSASLLTTVVAADGFLDPSFNGAGIVTTDQNEFEQINDIAIQHDGKIVAVGHSGVFHESTQQSLSMIVARYNTDGSLDATFGSGGIVTTDIGTYAKAWAVAIQADGKIVVTGDAASFGASVDLTIFTMARYNTDGSLDATFDGDGVSQAVPAGFSVSPAITPQAMAIQADQKIAVAGVCEIASSLRFCVSRYNSNGSLDNTFDSDGLVMTDFDSSSGGFANDLSIQPDGKIVAAGQSFSPSGVIPALARYNPNGSVDTSFDSDGRVTMPNSVQFELAAVALQSNGKIVIVGRDFILFDSAVAVARYNSDGSIDETFGSGGIVTTSVGTGHSAATAVAIQTDGRIVTGGYCNFNFSVAQQATFSDFALVRYDTPVNQPPVVTITGPASGSVFAVNTPVNFTGTFTDDPGDTHVVEWIFDSSTRPEPIVVPVPDSTPVNTTVAFTDPGVYKVSLRVTDNNFLSGIATTVNGLDASVVIYDPNGGWVAGGGWIDSPKGAYVLMPQSAGRANFGFISKYQKGASVPTGSLEFQFNAGSLKFQSTSFEWLVVSGGSKAQYKGTGMINRSGSYQFMLTAIDGDQPGGDGQDKLRIRIWDGNVLIYDNELNAPDSNDPTILGGGSIVIHH